MSAHWIFKGGKKVTESVYMPEKSADDVAAAAGDHPQTVSFSVPKQHINKKSHVYLPSSYIYPGAPVEQVANNEPQIQTPIAEEPNVEASAAEVVAADKTTDSETDAPPLDPLHFIDEFRRKQSELEQMVERFCSVTALKSESLVSFARALPSVQAQQPVVSKAPAPVVAAQPTPYASFTAAPATTQQVEVNRAPVVSFSRAAPPTMTTRIDTHRPAHKKRLNEPSQYLGSTLNELRFAFDKPVIDPWAAAQTHAVEEAAYKETSEQQPPVVQYSVQRRGLPYDPSEYHFELNGRK